MEPKTAGGDTFSDGGGRDASSRTSKRRLRKNQEEGVVVKRLSGVAVEKGTTYRTKKKNYERVKRNTKEGRGSSEGTKTISDRQARKKQKKKKKTQTKKKKKKNRSNRAFSIEGLGKLRGGGRGTS